MLHNQKFYRNLKHRMPSRLSLKLNKKLKIEKNKLRVAIHKHHMKVSDMKLKVILCMKNMITGVIEEIYYMKIMKR